MLGSPPNAVDEPRRDCAGRAHLEICMGQRVDVLEWRPTLDALDVLPRRQRPGPESDEHDNSGERELKHDVTRSGLSEEHHDRAHRPGARTVALGVLVEDESVAGATRL